MQVEVSETGAKPGRSRFFAGMARTFTLILSSGGLVTGLIILLFMVVVAIAAPLLAPHDPYAPNVMNTRIPPAFFDHPKASWAHPLGTDQIGRDYLSRLFYGARTSLMIGLIAVLLSGTIGVTLGVLAGYFRGRVDAVISFIITTRISIPVILVALAVSSLYGSSMQVLPLVIGGLLWDRFAIVARAKTMQVRSMDYITSARAMGSSTFAILMRDVLPNIGGSIAVVAALEMAEAILLESALSFLGLGVQPPTAAWGLMLAEAQVDLNFHPWLMVIPGAAIFLLVLAINLIGDGVQEVFSPGGRS